jgi:hypothetical protein
MSKEIIKGDEANRFPHAADELSASSQPPHSASCVIPFPQDRRAAMVDLAAAGDPRKDPAAFIPLGSAVAAVVMRLGRARPSIKVLAQTTREGDSDLGES